MPPIYISIAMETPWHISLVPAEYASQPAEPAEASRISLTSNGEDCLKKEIAKSV